MSPQAAVSSSSRRHRVSLVSNGSDNSFLSSLIEAADEAYQKTSDEYTPSSSAQVHAGPGRTAAATGGRPRFNLRKRKTAAVVPVNTGASCVGGPSASDRFSTTFLSGLFADLEQRTGTASASSPAASADEHYVTDGESCPNTPVPSPKKRPRLGFANRSLSRCTKSYASLAVLASTYNSTDSYVDEPIASENPQKESTESGLSASAAGEAEPSAADAVASDVLTDSLTAAAALADAIFPHLPATVSESPLQNKIANKLSADLTAQPQASGTEVSLDATPTHVEPEKELTLAEVFAPAAGDGPASAAVTPTGEDLEQQAAPGEDSYGWFLALDSKEEHITDAYGAGGDGASTPGGSTSNLAFQASVSAAAGSAAADAEVEWAKAADTVDDVLGDLPF